MKSIHALGLSSLLVSSSLAHAAVIINPSTLNGGFEDGITTTPTTWVAMSGANSIIQRQASYAKSGSYSLVLGKNADNVTLTNAVIDTAYSIQTGDTYALSFSAKGAFQASSTSQINFTLFYTSDNTLTGTRTNILASTQTLNGATGDVATSPYNSYSFSSLQANAAAAGKTLFLAFEPGSGLGANQFARLDDVSLIVNPIPETSSAALCGLTIFMAATLRRRRTN